ncbi:TPA: hypothetical protein ACH3X2_011732 [Trebouxia sp. C0005]|nr:MAG: hypothetical protein FRX49_02604 [Trebouxia sp. A1-2]
MSFARLLASDDASELSQYRMPLVFHQPAHDAEQFLTENEADNEADRSQFAGGLTLPSDAFDHLEVDQATADRYQEYEEQFTLQHRTTREHGFVEEGLQAGEADQAFDQANSADCVPQDCDVSRWREATANTSATLANEKTAKATAHSLNVYHAWQKSVWWTDIATFKTA